MSFGVTNTHIGRDEKRCRTCRFYNFADDRVQDSHGVCKRHAPRPLVAVEDLSKKECPSVYWPLVGFYDWCGEWEWEEGLDGWIDDPAQNPGIERDLRDTAAVEYLRTVAKRVNLKEDK